MILNQLKLNSNSYNNRFDKFVKRTIISAGYHYKKIQVFIINKIKTTKWYFFDGIINKILAEYILLTCKHILSKDCLHIRNHGGVKECLIRVNKAAQKYKYVYKTDIYSYYASINHDVLLSFFKINFGSKHFVTRLIQRHLNLIKKYAPHLTGVTRGSSLSPIFAAIYLNELDFVLGNKFKETHNIEYLRYVDDIIIFSSCFETIIKAKQKLNKIINDKKLELRPEKSYFGLVKQRFDFVGFNYDDLGLNNIAKKTFNKFSINYHNNLLLNENNIYFKHFNAYLKGVIGSHKLKSNKKISSKLNETKQLITAKQINKINKIKNNLDVINIFVNIDFIKKKSKKIVKKQISKLQLFFVENFINYDVIEEIKLQINKYKKLKKYQTYKKAYKRRKRKEFMLFITKIYKQYEFH